jgi:hypothetical protein
MFLKFLLSMDCIARKCASLALVLLFPATILAYPRNASPAGAAVHFTIADFDGDSQPDIATVQTGQANSFNTRYWIGFQLSTGARSIVAVTAPAGGLRISSRDMNGDNFLDVVVTTAWADRPVTVLLNDGHGNFTPSDPAGYASLLENSETFWSGAGNEIRDAAILLLRQPSGQSEKRGTLEDPAYVTGSTLFRCCCDYFLFGSPSSFGRAPPSL